MSAKRKTAAVYSCLRCPACGTDLCGIAQDLGTYCGTQWSATIAKGDSQPEDVRARGKQRVPAPRGPRTPHHGEGAPGAA